MGIYPTTKITGKSRMLNGGETWTETYDSYSGVIHTRRVVADPWSEERTNCFCCSCPDLGPHDMFCRNHGSIASRPCEKHGMPGAATDEGLMPESVEVQRSKYIVPSHE